MDGWELGFIDAQRFARLGTIAADGRPHLVPVCFARLGDDVAIAIDEKPKRGGELARVRNLRRDPRATLLFDRTSEEWEELAWVRADCTATILVRGDKWPAALAALRLRYRQYDAMALEARPLLRLHVERLTSWRWRGA